MKRVILNLLITIHFLVIIGNIYGFTVLTYYGFQNLFGLGNVVYWPVSLACCSFIFRITFNNSCVCTEWENALRTQLGMKQINSFIGHYVMKHFYVLRNKLNANS